MKHNFFFFIINSYPQLNYSSDRVFVPLHGLMVWGYSGGVGLVDL